MTTEEVMLPPRRLGDLFPDLPLTRAAREIEVSGISLDSRKVRPGELFAALPGSRTDGLGFVGAAVRNGAAAVLAAGVPAELGDAALVVAPEPRAAIARAAARFYGPMPHTIVGVTGTAGKTSVVQFTRQLWKCSGFRAAAVGTLGVVGPAGSHYGGLTTPDPVELAMTLGALAREGVTHVALEASSHGIDQHRLDGLVFAAAAFTNIGRDHLDYHPSQEAYLDAKLRLFRELLPDGSPVVVAEGEPGAQEVIAAASVRGLPTLTVGGPGSDLAVLEQEAHGMMQDVLLEWGGVDRRIHLPLAGDFQLCNALLAAGLVIATGGAASTTLAHLENLHGVPGRLELVGETADGAAVFVDYAHKPDALGHALDALRPFASGRLIVVFGAGGDRDPGKRALMGAVAAKKADIVIVTDDNPRSEQPGAIRAAILAASPDAIEIGDRHDAIAAGIGKLRSGDVLLIAGKGHETGQIVGDHTFPFDDRSVARAVLRET